MEGVAEEDLGGFGRFFRSKIDELTDDCDPGVGKVTRNLKRLQAQRNELNAKGMYPSTLVVRPPPTCRSHVHSHWSMVHNGPVADTSSSIAD